MLFKLLLLFISWDVYFIMPQFRFFRELLFHHPTFIYIMLHLFQSARLIYLMPHLFNNAPFLSVIFTYVGRLRPKQQHRITAYTRSCVISVRWPILPCIEDWQSIKEFETDWRQSWTRSIKYLGSEMTSTNTDVHQLLAH